MPVSMDFGYFREYYGLIAIDFSKQAKLIGPQQILLGILKTNLMEQQCFFIFEKSEKNTFDFLQNYANIL